MTDADIQAAIESGALIIDDERPEPTTEELWEAFRAHEIAAVMSGGQVDNPSEWGL